MSRVQLALNVTDLDAAVSFYATLFGTEPAKRRPGYANFAITEPPLKLVLIEDPGGRSDGVTGALNHLGVEVETPEEVEDASRRLAQAGLDPRVQEATTCCYAVQDKAWVSDPDGAPWEVYTVLADATDATDMGCSGETCGPAAGQVVAAGATAEGAGATAAPAVLLLRQVPVAAGAEAMTEAVLWRRLLAELMGSALLATVVVGSGIAAQQLSPGNTGLQLLENAAATAAGLYAIILMFGPVSGAHFNPVVSFVDAAFGGVRWRTAWFYLPAQVAGCIGGAVLANLMFARAAVSISTHHRASPAHFLSELVATFGLIVVIFSLARSGRSRTTPAAVAAYIGAAYFFTSSTSFANPAITVGRMFSDTFAGIAPSSAPSFVIAQMVGGLLAFGLIVLLYPGLTPAEASDIIVPHHGAPDGAIATDAP